MVLAVVSDSVCRTDRGLDFIADVTWKLFKQET